MNYSRFLCTLFAICCIPLSAEHGPHREPKKRNSAHNKKRNFDQKMMHHHQMRDDAINNLMELIKAQAPQEEIKQAAQKIEQHNTEIKKFVQKHPRIKPPADMPRHPQAQKIESIGKRMQATIEELLQSIHRNAPHADLEKLVDKAEQQQEEIQNLIQPAMPPREQR